MSALTNSGQQLCLKAFRTGDTTAPEYAETKSLPITSAALPQVQITILKTKYLFLRDFHQEISSVDGDRVLSRNKT